MLARDEDVRTDGAATCSAVREPPALAATVAAAASGTPASAPGAAPCGLTHTRFPSAASEASLCAGQNCLGCCWCCCWRCDWRPLPVAAGMCCFGCCCHVLRLGPRAGAAAGIPMRPVSPAWAPRLPAAPSARELS
eukprot:364182-Chlamydomonas_euryale.AAC.2